MIENRLTDGQKVRYFDFATKFQVTDEVAIEYRGSLEEKTDVWTIISDEGECYNHRDKNWEWEPTPSERSEAFIERTRYRLDKAFDIVTSAEFRGMI